MSGDWQDISTAKHSTEEPTVHIRWSATGKLQQAFFIREYANGCPMGARSEWRDVPTETHNTPSGSD